MYQIQVKSVRGGWIMLYTAETSAVADGLYSQAIMERHAPFAVRLREKMDNGNWVTIKQMNHK